MPRVLIMLWLALYFPQLPREALASASSPSAVTARGRVVVADPAAQTAGIEAGLSLAAALGRVPSLALLARDPLREEAARVDRAIWAGRFTPHVSLDAGGLRLEVGGCLRLFGGRDALLSALQASLLEQGWETHWALAPTPLGAAWLARGAESGGSGVICDRPDAMYAALDALPWRVADWPAAVADQLDAFGLPTLGALRSVPSAGLRQRLGEAVVNALWRAYGELPDPQAPFTFPEHFEARLELPGRVEQASALLFAAQRLLARLSGWLTVRQQRARQLNLTLLYSDHTASDLPLHLSEASADEARWRRVLQARLERLELTAPVEGLQLSVTTCESAQHEARSLFSGSASGEGAAACLERLQARLGEGAVHVLDAVADYRPECASRLTPLQAVRPEKSPSGRSTVGARPFWLLPAPLPLDERKGAPYWQGPLQRLSRAERLESGWWDEGEAGAVGDLRRDYCVARSTTGALLWIFRDADGWFLHGFFA